MKRIDARDASAEHVRALLEGGEVFWLDVDSSDARQHAMLADVFRFHPLAIEDTLNRHTRVKVEEYDGYLFMVLRAMRFNGEAVEDARKLDVSKVCLFLGLTYLVSVHAKESAIVDAAAVRAEALPPDCRDPGRIAHLIADVTIDEYFPILDRVDEFAERLERTELAEVDRRTFREIMRVRRIAFAAHRSLRPQQAIFNALAHRPYALVSGEARLYFRDVYDHAERIAESLDTYRDLIGSTTDSYIAQLSTRLDYATTIFAAIATVAMPFVVISGLYGMNVRWLPLADSAYGFWILFVVQCSVSFGLFLALRGRRLL